MWEKMAMVTKDAAEQFGIWMKIIKILEKVNLLFCCNTSTPKSDQHLILLTISPLNQGLRSLE